MTDPMLIEDMGVTLIESAASDEMVAMAAWVSHDADNEARLQDKAKVAGLIKFLYRNKHMSPFEHGHFTFKVDVPLFVAREWHRHRTASYNEVSGRYTVMEPRFYVGGTARVQEGKPGAYYFVDGTDDQTAIYKSSKRKAVKRAWREYNSRLEAGIAKEQAREDLPLSLMTQFYVTMNPRNLMQFLTLRNDKHALKEIRDCAVLIEEIFAQEMPLTYDAYKAESRAPNYKDLYEGLKVEYSALSKINTRIQGDLNYFTKQNRDILAIYKERDEANALRDEAVEKYNALYTSTQEAKKDAPEWNEATARVLNETDDNTPNTESINDRFAVGEKPMTLVFNFEKAVDPAEIARKVNDAVLRRESL